MSFHDFKLKQKVSKHLSNRAIALLSKALINVFRRNDASRSQSSFVWPLSADSLKYDMFLPKPLRDLTTFLVRTLSIFVTQLAFQTVPKHYAPFLDASLKHHSWVFRRCAHHHEPPQAHMQLGFRLSPSSGLKLLNICRTVSPLDTTEFLTLFKILFYGAVFCLVYAVYAFSAPVISNVQDCSAKVFGWLRARRVDCPSSRICQVQYTVLRLKRQNFCIFVPFRQWMFQRGLWDFQDTMVSEAV